MPDARLEREIGDFTAVEGDPPPDAPAPGQIYTDTVLNGGELCEVLHVGASAVIVQRKNGVGRYPIWDFRPGGRFNLVLAD